MTTNISTISKGIFGIGHVMEDENPVPHRFRKDTPSKPVDEKVSKQPNNSSKRRP
jgi:hypothetical protein